ncbi:cyun87 [Cyclophragma undans nucleopolyhedrovirus]|uniref:Cyun87 n=1 Tax=Cyclophragma undans nucleopolyhedrovirus TaxID=1906244 RepID=A0A288QAA6_9ABAC|nr:cyun87 [Cyclophragma undans nucleopolyhedrovirus]AOT85545.1 cyun87 [Cyclophragma undans nucleopolyhedrovirus]
MPDLFLNKMDVYQEITEQRKLIISQIFINNHIIFNVNCTNCLQQQQQQQQQQQYLPHLKHAIFKTYKDVFDFFVALYYSKNIFCSKCNNVAVYIRAPQQCHWRYVVKGYLTSCHEINCQRVDNRIVIAVDEGYWSN